MTKVFNGTPHAINVVKGSTFNPNIRKFTGGSVSHSIPSNGMLNAKIETVSLPDIEGIPCFGKAITGVDPLPEGFDIYIVSAIYASAAKAAAEYGSEIDMSKIYTVSDPVMSDDGQTFIGCRGICPAF